jgi:hypothetical protein
MDQWNIEGGHECNWKWDNFIEEGKKALEHTSYLIV